MIATAALWGGATIDFNVPREWKPKHLAPTVSSGTVRMISWNIDHGRRLDTLTGELKKEPGDILLLQEGDWNANRSGRIDVAEELARRLDLNVVYGIEFEELSQERETPAYIGQATL